MYISFKSVFRFVKLWTNNFLIQLLLSGYQDMKEMSTCEVFSATDDFSTSIHFSFSLYISTENCSRLRQYTKTTNYA
jgi:hypothetical protein